MAIDTRRGCARGRGYSRGRARGARPAQALRLARGGEGRLLPNSRGRDLRPARAQRGRQDHDDLDGLRPAGARRGRGDDRRRADRRRGRRGEGRHRVRAPGPRDLPGPHRPREPRVLRPAVRPGRGDPQVAHERGPRPHRSRRPGEGPHVDVQWRDAAPAQHRDRAAPPAAAAAARRAHRRRRPAEPQRDPRVDRRPGQGRHGGPVHHPLHGGGRAALRPDRDHRRR